MGLESGLQNELDESKNIFVVLFFFFFTSERALGIEIESGFEVNTWKETQGPSWLTFC